MTEKVSFNTEGNGFDYIDAELAERNARAERYVGAKRESFWTRKNCSIRAMLIFAALYFLLGFIAAAIHFTGEH